MDISWKNIDSDNKDICMYIRTLHLKPIVCYGHPKPLSCNFFMFIVVVVGHGCRFGCCSTCSCTMPLWGSVCVTASTLTALHHWGSHPCIVVITIILEGLQLVVRQPVVASQWLWWGSSSRLRDRHEGMQKPTHITLHIAWLRELRSEVNGILVNVACKFGMCIFFTELNS